LVFPSAQLYLWVELPQPSEAQRSHLGTYLLPLYARYLAVVSLDILHLLMLMAPLATLLWMAVSHWSMPKVGFNQRSL